MNLSTNLEFEKAVRFLAERLPESAANSRKPLLFHDIRVGVYLYERGYTEDIVIAGLLHDVLEWSDTYEDELENEFGKDILRLVQANTKDDTILDKEDKTNELIKRCVAAGEKALIIKAADILDSFKWYSSQNNKGELEYCLRNAKAILKYKPEDFDDKIIEEIRKWEDKIDQSLGE